ncbi:MAG: DNA-invertase hin [Wolbachia endosymbiont of Ctenocephalides orientis wCori]|nr:MAG: DNA-invertase hin [Wolbachia endosymbiont of Ctenocephalides orientis wCori]
MNKEVRCAIYTRKSNEDGLEQEINSLEAQRLAGESYILSHQQEGWKIVSKRYDNGGCSGKNLKRPALQELFKDIKGGEIDCVVVYKIDRLSRVLFDFAKVVEILDGNKATFVVVTQPINTTTSIGRLILNVLLSFAQFEREITIDRVKDKIAISKEKGLRMGGSPPLGYDIQEKKLIINIEEAKVIEHMFERFIALKSLTALARELNSHGYRTKRFQAKSGRMHGGEEFKKATLRRMITNPIYTGKIRHHDKHYKGQHEGIIGEEKWNAVQELIESRPLRIARYQDALLKSVIRCQICNVSMTPTHTKKKNKRYRYYVCSNHLRGSIAHQLTDQ